MSYFSFQGNYEVTDGDGVPFQHEGRPTVFEEVRYVAKDMDAFAGLQGDGAARVSVGLSLKLSGPNYSSASLQVNVTLTCHQSAQGVHRAEQLALEETSSFLDLHIPLIEGILDGRARK